MSRPARGGVFLGLLLVLLGSGACGSSKKETQAPQSPLGPPAEELLFSLPADRTFVHSKVSDNGAVVAFWVRKPGSVELFVTGSPPIEFKGHVGFQQGMSFHAVQPASEKDRLIAAPEAENDAWLVWGPGAGLDGEPLDDYLVFAGLANACVDLAEL